VLPACQKYGIGVIAWSPLSGGWLTGRIRRDTGVDMTRGRARRIPPRFDPSLPGNVAKLAAVEELIKIAADAGCSLTHLALAFVIGHPAVTSAIVGPRTMEQLTDLMAGASVTLDDDVLDRIDQIVPPGVTLNPADAGWQSPVLADPAARRRPLPARAANLGSDPYTAVVAWQARRHPRMRRGRRSSARRLTTWPPWRPGGASRGSRLAGRHRNPEQPRRDGGDGRQGNGDRGALQDAGPGR
jgi:Aldo/keto reductase family